MGPSPAVAVRPWRVRATGGTSGNAFQGVAADAGDPDIRQQRAEGVARAAARSAVTCQTPAVEPVASRNASGYPARAFQVLCMQNVAFVEMPSSRIVTAVGSVMCSYLPRRARSISSAGSPPFAIAKTVRAAHSRWHLNTFEPVASNMQAVVPPACSIYWAHSAMISVFLYQPRLPVAKTPCARLQAGVHRFFGSVAVNVARPAAGRRSRQVCSPTSPLGAAAGRPARGAFSKLPLRGGRRVAQPAPKPGSRL